MKAQNLLFVLLFTTLLPILNVNAQTRPCMRFCNGQGCGGFGMINSLQLDQDQQVAWEALRDQFRQDLKTIREDENLTATEKREKISELQSTHRDQVKAILTEEQKEEFDSCCPQRGFRGNMRGGGPRFYHDEETHDFILQKRMAFDNELSESEKNVIANMRTLMEQHRELMQNLQPGELSYQERREMHQDQMEKMEPLYEIADNHKESLEEINDEIGREIRANCPNNNLGQGYRHRGFGRGYGMHMGSVEDRHIIHFLLLDPAESSDLQESSSSSDNLNLYPNPAKSELNIAFTVKEEGPVTIELLDKSGEPIKLLDRSIRDIGENNYNCDISNLAPSDLYFVRVKMGDEVVVKKFIRE